MPWKSFLFALFSETCRWFYFVCLFCISYFCLPSSCEVVRIVRRMTAATFGLQQLHEMRFEKCKNQIDERCKNSPFVFMCKSRIDERRKHSQFVRCKILSTEVSVVFWSCAQCSTNMFGWRSRRPSGTRTTHFALRSFPVVGMEWIICGRGGSFALYHPRCPCFCEIPSLWFGYLQVHTMRVNRYILQLYLLPCEIMLRNSHSTFLLTGDVWCTLKIRVPSGIVNNFNWHVLWL